MFKIDLKVWVHFLKPVSKGSHHTANMLKPAIDGCVLGNVLRQMHK